MILETIAGSLFGFFANLEFFIFPIEQNATKSCTDIGFFSQRMPKAFFFR